MKKKSICVVTTKSSTIEAFLLEQLYYLQKNGYDVTIVCDVDVELEKKLPKSISYYPIPMKRGIEIGMIIIIWKLFLLFKRERFDIVQYSTPNAAFYASIASSLANRPIRLYCQWGIRYVGYRGLRRLIFKLIEKITCLLSTDIEPDSFSNLQFAREEGLYSSKNSRVIWNGSANGVNIEKFDINKKNEWRNEIRKYYNIQDSEFVYGFCGRLVKDKGINELIAAYKIINENFVHNSKLLIVGSYDDDINIDQQLMSWARESQSVILCGYTNEIEKYYSAMDVFILPSYREGFGSVVIEAEAMGNAVIVTDIPGPVDAMKTGVTGLTVRKGEVGDLVNAMIKLFDEADLLLLMKENAVVFSRENFEQKKLWKHVLNDRNLLIQRTRTKSIGVFRKNA